MKREGLGCFVSVISHARPANFPNMDALVGPATWYVAPGEAEAYTKAGAAHVVEAGGLCPSRNRALRDAWAAELPCVQLSDDLKKLELALGPKQVRALLFSEAVGMMQEATAATGAKMAGIAPTANAFYFNPNRPVHTAAFILGDFFYARPCGIFFDEELKLKEDYDYTLQHLREFRKVVRLNSILGHFAHRTNAGGAVEFRTAEHEQEAIAHLKQKWGAVIRDNPRRPNEILLSL